MGLLSLAVSLLSLCAPSGRALVNEVLYDAIGDDTGWEFVELLNPTAVPVALAGLRIEAGDGSLPGRWTLRWTAAAGDTVAPHAWFVVGGARVSPAVDRIASLDLQNGPDAVRLVWPDGVVEVVGWGAHEFAEYTCGEPAPDAPSGSALARVPDGIDRGANAADFRVAVASPGAANQPQRDASLLRGRARLVPERPAAGESATLEVTLENRGALAWASGEAVLAVQGEPLAAAGAWPLPALASGDSLRHAQPLGTLLAARGAIVARVSLPGDATPSDDADTLLVRVGQDPVRLTEVQFHPAEGEGEWLELRNASSESLSLVGWTLADRSATRGRILTAPPLEPESLLVLAQSRASLLARFPALDTARVREVSPWPSLNNSDDTTGIADVIDLREADGVPATRLTYSAAGVRTGRPLVWSDGAWRAAEDSGTPLAPPARFVMAPVAFASPSPRVAAGAALQLEWSLPWPRARVTIELHDLAGRRVARLLADAAVAGRERRAFARPDAPAGVLVARLSARPESGEGTVTRTLALRLEQEAR